MELLERDHQSCRTRIRNLEDEILLLAEVVSHLNSNEQHDLALKEFSSEEGLDFRGFRDKALGAVRLERELSRIETQRVEELRLRLKQNQRVEKEPTSLQVLTNRERGAMYSSRNNISLWGEGGG